MQILCHKLASNFRLTCVGQSKIPVLLIINEISVTVTGKNAEKLSESCLILRKECFLNFRAPLYKWQVGMARSSWFIDCWMRGRGSRLMRCRSMTITHPSTWHQPTDTMESLRSYLCTSQVCVIRQLHWVRNNLICQHG